MLNHRLGSMLLACSLAAAAWSAPAPVYRPGTAKPWQDGWDAPVDPVGGCRFDRKGETLTVSGPGKGLELDLAQSRRNARRLMRWVEGDFTLEVRVSGDFTSKGGNLLSAGVVLLSGPYGAWAFQRCGRFFYHLKRETGSESLTSLEAPRGGVTYLRLTRRGQRLLAEGRCGGGWEQVLDTDGYFPMPKKVAVGVFVESTEEEGQFKAVFDRLKLTRPRQGK